MFVKFISCGAFYLLFNVYLQFFNQVPDEQDDPRYQEYQSEYRDKP